MNAEIFELVQSTAKDEYLLHRCMEEIANGTPLESIDDDPLDALAARIRAILQDRDVADYAKGLPF